jgi:carboxymethylenebutenolidase
VLEWADLLVAAGRRVVLPDRYAGAIAHTVAEAEALQRSLDFPATLRQLERCADELTDDHRPWAAMGFSVGAFYACHLAGRAAAAPDELVLFYGGQPPAGGPAPRTRRVTLHVVPDDEFFTEAVLARVEDAFRPTAEVLTYRYSDQAHSFAERGSATFDEAGFELARRRVLAQLAVG